LLFAERKLLSAFDAGSSAYTKERFMQNLSPRHVKTEEALWLGVVSGWYKHK